MWTISLPLSVPVSKRKNFSLNLNIYRNAHHMVLNKAKTTFTNQILNQLKRIPQQSLISLTYTVFLPNQRKTDISNIGSVTDKFFSDALVEARVIPDDNYTYLNQVSFLFGGVDRVNPRVDVTIKPVIEKETNMRIILTQKDLQTALENYISSKVIISDNEELSVKLTDDGAEIIISESANQGAVFPSAPFKRGRKPKAEETQEVVAEKEEEQVEIPFRDQDEEEKADTKESSDEVVEEEETKPKTKSLFGGLNRPKN